MLNDSQKSFLLKLARETIKCKLENRDLDLKPPQAEVYKQRLGAFVTLNKDGELRGCIGFIKGIKPLYETIVEMALAAAFQDYRFPAVTSDELEAIQIEISILSKMKLVKDLNKIKIGKHGLYLTQGYQSGLLLPQVPIKWNWDRKTFLKQICRKAGLSQDCWKDSETEIFKFTAEVFSE